MFFRSVIYTHNFRDMIHFCEWRLLTIKCVISMLVLQIYKLAVNSRKNAQRKLLQKHYKDTLEHVLGRIAYALKTKDEP